ncbi:MAG: hypothetical protein V4644_02445 [Patescibacteria group bacterium]
MKSTFIYSCLVLAICVSVYFTYQRSFITRDFEVINSEEELEEESAEELMGAGEEPMESDEPAIVDPADVTE